MAEQLGLEQLGGNGAAIDDDERPLAAEAVARLYARLVGPVALYDPEGIAAALFALYPQAPPFVGLYVRDVTEVGEQRAGYVARALTDLPDSGARIVLVAAFDAGRIAARIAHLLPPGAESVLVTDDWNGTTLELLSLTSNVTQLAKTSNAPASNTARPFVHVNR